ncbi:hypothetical protein PAXRUDRAFT_146297 [Paxillus rubicundulus Ve08.2h10]|uniref:Uncharacterized protein n=1 Tax=Paxillus rubicundulus Ve08.2h10 TaxID=930991 RepID=A0A0D0DML2_9AGAM|nr:hypothetical protein PAXRUDRAFT_146297 [Paxillus rubicundulus Ve08.2h10]
MTLPQAEAALEEHLVAWFEDSNWRLALKAIMDAEGAIADALKAVDKLSKAASSCSGLKLHIPAIPALPLPKPSQVVALETDLHVMDSVHYLKSHNHIFGTLLMINRFLDPVEERTCVGIQKYTHSLDGSFKGIFDEVQQEIAISNGDIIEIKNDDNDIDDDLADPSLSHADLIKLCA